MVCIISIITVSIVNLRGNLSVVVVVVVAQGSHGNCASIADLFHPVYWDQFEAAFCPASKLWTEQNISQTTGLIPTVPFLTSATAYFPQVFVLYTTPVVCL